MLKKRSALVSASGLAIVFTAIAGSSSLAQPPDRYSRCPNFRSHQSDDRSAFCYRRGDRGENIAGIQRWLSPRYYQGGEDGIFGPNLEQSIKRLQRRHGLTPDGIIGRETITTICNLFFSDPTLTDQQQATTSAVCRTQLTSRDEDGNWVDW